MDGATREVGVRFQNREEAAALIKQNSRIYAAEVAPGTEVKYTLDPKRHAWVQVVKGAVAVNGHRMEHGDGAGLTDESLLTLRGENSNGEILLFDLS